MPICTLIPAPTRSIKTYMRASGGRLSIEKVYEIGRALVNTLQVIHASGIVHRDVKPENIMLPLNGALEPYLIDFGAAQGYRDSETGKHKAPLFIQGPGPTQGALPFMSINVHDGRYATRRDDMVSLAYTLIYLAHGTLPWYHSKDVRLCRVQKQAFRPSQLTPPLPLLELVLDHALNLGFEDEPNYTYLESQLH